MRSLVSRGITGESLQNCYRACCCLIDSHRHRSIHTRVVHVGASGPAGDKDRSACWTRQIGGRSEADRATGRSFSGKSSDI